MNQAELEKGVRVALKKWSDYRRSWAADAPNAPDDYLVATLTAHIAETVQAAEEAAAIKSLTDALHDSRYQEESTRLARGIAAEVPVCIICGKPSNLGDPCESCVSQAREQRLRAALEWALREYSEGHRTDCCDRMASGLSNPMHNKHCPLVAAREAALGAK